MPTVNVPREEWLEFLETFSRQHRAWLATVEQPAGHHRAAAGDPRPLERLRPEGDRRRVSAIEITLRGDARDTVVRVENPIAVRVQKTNEGADDGLEIVNEEGISTRVRFRAAAMPEMLDGLAPGEL